MARDSILSSTALDAVRGLRLSAPAAPAGSDPYPRGSAGGPGVAGGSSFHELLLTSFHGDSSVAPPPKEPLQVSSPPPPPPLWISFSACTTSPMNRGEIPTVSAKPEPSSIQSPYTSRQTNNPHRLLDAHDAMMVADQQQDEPGRPESHDGSSRSSEKQEEASSLLVMDTQGTCKADMRVSRIAAGDNGEQTDNKVASVAHDEEERQMESVNWDPYELRNFFDSYIDALASRPPDENAESWAKIEELEESEITKLKERLALCRIRAHELLKEGQARDVEELKTDYSSTALEANGYFDMYEQSFEWYFDIEFCDIGGFQDYQRLVLRNTYAYLKPAKYRETNDTYEVDQEFVKFYEKLEMETKGIVTDLEDRKLQWEGSEALAFLRALKIAVGFRKIFKKLFFSSVQEFLWSIEFDCTCHNECAQLYFEIWKRVTKQEMDFYRALRQIHEQNICPMFSVLMEPELKYEETPKNHSPKPGSIKHTYDTFMAEIPADATEHLAQQLIKDAVKKIVPKKKTYYDYTKKKLEIAEKIQLIPCESW